MGLSLRGIKTDCNMEMLEAPLVGIYIYMYRLRGFLPKSTKRVWGIGGWLVACALVAVALLLPRLLFFVICGGSLSCRVSWDTNTERKVFL